MYLDFEGYAALGGMAQAGEFERLAFKAGRVIDAATHGRIRGEADMRDAVKYCAFELIEAMRADEAQTGIGGRELASMSNDGVSVSFAAGSGGAPQRFAAIMGQYLTGEVDANGVQLLYAGVDA